MMPHRSNSQLLIWWSTLLRRKWKGTGAENVIWYILYYLSCRWFDERYILTVVHFQSSNCGVDPSEKNLSIYEIKKTHHGNYLNDFYSRVAMHQKLTRSLRSLVGFFDALQLMNIIVRTHLPWNNLYCYIPRLSLNKMSTVIGWFLVTCPWSNSNVSRPGYNSVVVARAPDTTACFCSMVV